MTVEIAGPRVTILASTSVEYDWDDYGDPSIVGMSAEFGSQLDDLAEFAGRSCYQSFRKPNPATRDNRDYLANILRQGHESVLEHASVTFYIEGVSRALTHELIRHRHLSYSQLSQRFVDEGRRIIVIPPALRGTLAQDILRLDADRAFDVYEGLVKTSDLPRKQAREAARAVLPNCCETKIVVTGNLRAWRDVIAKRYDEAADAEIREVAGMILDHLLELAPGSFQDFAEEDPIG